MDKSSLLKTYKKYTKQKHSKLTEEQLTNRISSLSLENRQVVFDLICISPLFNSDMLKLEQDGYSVDWSLIPFEIKNVVQVYLEKIQ